MGTGRKGVREGGWGKRMGNGVWSELAVGYVQSALLREREEEKGGKRRDKKGKKTEENVHAYSMYGFIIASI